MIVINSTDLSDVSSISTERMEMFLPTLDFEGKFLYSVILILLTLGNRRLEYERVSISGGD